MSATIKENTLCAIYGEPDVANCETEYLEWIDGGAEIICPDFAKALTDIGDDLGVVVDEWNLAISETGTFVLMPHSCSAGGRTVWMRDRVL